MRALCACNAAPLACRVLVTDRTRTLDFGAQAHLVSAVRNRLLLLMPRLDASRSHETARPSTSRRTGELVPATAACAVISHGIVVEAESREADRDQ